ncbi:MAG TPA: protein kinase, partial [Thermoanaerobaculia bacterium]|nr:protein kinase [Thermoanaerobaculia bacterium]
MTLPAGTRLGPYEILSPIGAGGMGEVYRALDTRLRREVAIKIPPQELARNPAVVARFEREARAIASLAHPNVLDIHDFGREGEIWYAVTELLEGENLRRRLADGPLPWREAVAIA